MAAYLPNQQGGAIGGGGIPNPNNMMMSMATIVNPQQEKINRELFVGNTPPGTSELLILHFLSAAMRRANLCGQHEQPIVDSRVNNKFAFIELASSELADKALSLNGIPFLGVYLKVSRPSKYVPLPGSPPLSNIPPTWQALTGQSLPDGAMLDTEQEKLSRELFIGNTTPEMTESMIREFLGNAMQQVGLCQEGMPVGQNPITACRVSGKFAFIELRTAQEAKNALNLNNIPFLGTALRVGRPSKWTGGVDQHGNWEDILAKYMAGEINVAGAGGTAAADGATGTNTQQQQPTRIVELINMLSPEDISNEEELAEILGDTKEECSQFGTLVNVIIPKAGEVGATKVFLEYSTTDDSTKALQALEGRTFDGRQVQANYFDESKYQNKDYS